MTMIYDNNDKNLKENASNNTKNTYNCGFFELFGKGANLGFNKEPDDLPPDKKL